MRSLGFIIVQSDQDYNNEVEVGGKKIVVNSTIESVENINREATVVAAPKGTILKEGDKVIIHHNIMRRKNSVSGQESRSSFHIEDGMYYVPPMEVFAYKRDSEWVALEPFCFVEPIKLIEKEVGGIVLSGKAQVNYKGRENGVGTLYLSNKELASEGFKLGDRVHFEPFSEHEFIIDGVTVYKMKTSDILAKETA